MARFLRHEWTRGSWGIAEISIIRSPHVVKGFLCMELHSLVWKVPCALILSWKRYSRVQRRVSAIPWCSRVQFSIKANSKFISLLFGSHTTMSHVGEGASAPCKEKSQDRMKAEEPRFKTEFSFVQKFHYLDSIPLQWPYIFWLLTRSQVWLTQVGTFPHHLDFIGHTPNHLCPVSSPMNRREQT